MVSESKTPRQHSIELLNQKLDEDTKAALDAKRQELLSRQLPLMDDYVIEAIINDVDTVSSDLIDSDIYIGRSKDAQYKELCDLTIDTLPYVRAKKQPVDKEKILENLRGLRTVEDVSVVGPYYNISLDAREIAPAIINQVLENGENYGHSQTGDRKTVVVDYSSPNIAKKMTVAHLRSTIIGQSIMDLQAAIGNIPFGINHIGDWGAQFGGIFAVYRHYQAERPEALQAMIDENPTEALLQIYREYNQLKKTDDTIISSARELWHRMENGDEELVDLWIKFRNWSLEEFAKTYLRLDIGFDTIQGESFYEDKMDGSLKEAVAAGVLRQNPDGSIVFPSQVLIDARGRENDRIMFDKSNQPKDEILQTPDGGSMYLTRDLAAIRYRAEELGADEVIYVIGKEQETHCIKLFNIASQMGYFALESLKHAKFGHLNIGGQKMKSREGKVVMLDDLLDSAEASAKKGMLERRTEDREWTDKDTERAIAIGRSALIFDDLKQDRTKDMEFRFDVAEKIDSSGSMQIQYTHARLQSILRQVGEADDKTELEKLPENIEKCEKDLIIEMAWFPKIIREAGEKCEPHHLAAYLSEFAKVINKFYKKCKVLNAADDTTKDFRLVLVKAANQILENGSRLLHISLPGEI